ncbi:hypothetical protein M409DRAFT_67345 [Zasmidium cellare ATCC 36951]|uniref:Pentatricopeptide repeat-containing protein-mitochondrial domain-containing protein n=1 Tax=Zasmidium cellare ATCC 36951 TaxID=1080233 RepID=A0A6A6CDB0_ZASCE|nr:uncharacterized protein M409DRAFT_67345 [Zasmidium cellare ATCC 36951]KAF2165031.1 hypothetical protein M409DRAFT_67345 [Zasmidium cellare ATCC 36951]
MCHVPVAEIRRCERATACLKAGARDSLKCAQQAPRSKRRLHSTFWAHGAGGLDLPPWAVSMPPTPTDLPLKDDSTGAKQTSCSRSPPCSILPHDGVFLDFLYPPQALAWLHRSQAQCCERWERRNARRLPEGFVQVPRGYSVRSYANASAAAVKGQKQDKSKNPLNGVAGINGIDAVEEHTDLHDNAQAQADHSVNSLVRQEPSDGQYSTGPGPDPDEFADTPGELAESAVDEPVVDPYKALRDLMAGRRATRGTDTTGQAWTLYMSLNDEEKQDTSLKTRLLMFFAAQGNDVADAHCISLYYAIPLKDRQLPIYQATLTAFLRRKDVEFALGLHKEALVNTRNGHHISKELFKHAVERGLWNILLQVEHHHVEACEESGQKSQLDMFWLSVSETPDLLDASTRLFNKICQWRNRKIKSDEQMEPYEILCAKLSEEALWQVLQAPWHEYIPSKNKKLYDLFLAIRQWNPKAPKILEEAMTSLLGQLISEDHYAKAYNAVSYLYKSYRQCGIPRVPEWMLLSLLQRTVLYAGSLRTLKDQKHTISVPSLVFDWEKDHGKLSAAGIHALMSFYARTGMPNELEEWYDRLCQLYPDFSHRKDVLWTLIYVHARRADIRKATETFKDVERTAKSNGEEVQLKCWNTLIHAYARVDDLEGALSTMKELMATGIRPDAYSMQPIAELLARRGDVEGVEDVLEQSDALVEGERSAPLISSYIQALVNNDQLERATQVLEETIEQMKAGEVYGSLTPCFNILMTTYALRRDLAGTMKVYRWMQANSTRTNALTYSALMQALIHLRQTVGARKILTSVMPKLGLRPTGLHYAIIIAGFSNQGMYQEAVDFYTKMRHHNIRPTLATQRTSLKAKALLEQKLKRLSGESDEAAPLQEVIADLQAAVESRDGSDITSKDPGFGYASYDLGRASAVYIDTVMYIHGTRRCLEAVAEMFRLYREQHPDQAQEPPPMRILTALMNALLHAKEYAQVELYWELAKQQADLIAPSQTVPDFAPPTTTPQISEPERSDGDTAEIGFSSARETTAAQPPQIIRTKSTPNVGPKPASARRYILTNAFRHYIDSLSRTNRAVDMVTVCTRLLSQGYRLDNHAWNKLIERLCTASPPLVLLAFTLTERFLIAEFPGWERWSSTKFTPKPSARAQRLQHIRARYLPPDALMPQYHTMVRLAAAYINLRRTEANWGTNPRRSRDQMQRLVGSIQEVRARAPTTLAAVQNMPQVNDQVQGRLLNS